MALRRILNLHFLTILTNTIEETIKFAKQMGILPQSVKCPNCKRNLEKPYILNRSKSGCKDIRYQHNRKECRGRGKRNVVSIKTGTWFRQISYNFEEELVFNLLFCSTK